METIEDVYGRALDAVRARAPALADAVAHLRPVFDGLGTIEFDGERMRVHARWFAGMSEAERASCLAGIGFRITSPLMRPCGDRDPFAWNLACSAVTNANLAAMGFSLPAGALLEPSCASRTSDEVYDTIKDIPGLRRPERPHS